MIFAALTAAAQELSEGAVEMRTRVPAEDGVPVAAAEDAGKTNAAEEVDSRLTFLSTAGMQYTEEGEYEEAERAYLRALESDPDNPEVRFRLSTLYIYMERYEDALRILEELVEEFPGNPQTRNNLAWVYSTAEGVIDGKLALRHAREAILIAPASAPLWNTLAEAYFASGDYDRALRSSEHALDLLKQQGGTEERLQEFMVQKNKIERAKEAYEQFMGTMNK